MLKVCDAVQGLRSRGNSEEDTGSASIGSSDVDSFVSAPEVPPEDDLHWILNRMSKISVLSQSMVM